MLAQVTTHTESFIAFLAPGHLISDLLLPQFFLLTQHFFVLFHCCKVNVFDTFSFIVIKICKP